MPVFAPVERSLCDDDEETVVESGVDTAVLELTADVGVVKVAEAEDARVLDENRKRLVAVQPSWDRERTVCKSSGEGATNCSFVGLLQAAWLFESTPQRCHKPEVLFVWEVLGCAPLRKARTDA